jgi:iron(III) transport system substrate-binding protein
VLRKWAVVPVVLVSALVLAGCGGDSEPTATPTQPTPEQGPLTVYSGRSEELVAPVIEQFETSSGVEVEVRYADSGQLAAQILEEGDRSPADLFLAQDAGALGAVARAGLAAAVPVDLLDLVPERYRAEDGSWVGVSGRARVIVYDPREVAPDEVPTSVFDLTNPRWAGEVGVAPANASFQSFVTAMRVLEGEEATRAWLEGLVAGGVEVFEGNTPILDGVDNGVVSIGLINHYYWYRKVAEAGAEAVPSRLQFLSGGDPGALVNVAGAQVLAGSDQTEQAEELLAFLLSEQAQRYFAEETLEYPLVEGVEPAADLPALSSLEPPDIDLSDLESLDETITLLEEVGLL